MAKVLWQQAVCISLVLCTLMTETGAVVGENKKTQPDNDATLFKGEPDMKKLIKLSQKYGLLNLVLQGHEELLHGFQDGEIKLREAFIDGKDHFDVNHADLEKFVSDVMKRLDSETDDYLDTLITRNFTHRDKNEKKQLRTSLPPIIGLDNYTDFDTYLEITLQKASRELVNATRDEFNLALKVLLRRVKAEVKSRLTVLNNQLRDLIEEITKLQKKNDDLGKRTVTEWFTEEVTVMVKDHSNGYISANIHWARLVSILQKEIIDQQLHIQDLDLEIVKYEKLQLRLEMIEQENRKLKNETLALETQIAVLKENKTQLQRYRVLYRTLENHYIILRTCYATVLREAVAIHNEVEVHIQSLTNITINADILKPGAIRDQAMVLAVASTWAQLQEMFQTLMTRKQNITEELHKSRKENAMLRSTVETSQRLLLWMRAQLITYVPHVDVDEELNNYANLIKEGYSKFAKLSTESNEGSFYDIANKIIP